jgi:hypothetical protein
VNIFWNTFKTKSGQNRTGQVRSGQVKLSPLGINLWGDITTYPDNLKQARGIFQVINRYKRYRVC